MAKLPRTQGEAHRPALVHRNPAAPALSPGVDTHHHSVLTGPNLLNPLAPDGPGLPNLRGESDERLWTYELARARKRGGVVPLHIVRKAVQGVLGITAPKRVNRSLDRWQSTCRGVTFTDDELAHLDELRPAGTSRPAFIRSLLREPPTGQEVATRTEALAIPTAPRKGRQGRRRHRT